MEKNTLLKILKVKNPTEAFAKIVSLVLNPVVILIPLPGYLIHETGGKVYPAIFWTLFSSIFIFIFFIFIAVGVRLKYFSDFDISKRKQRFVLYFFGIVLVSIYIMSLYFLQAPKIILIATLALTLGLIVLQIINSYLKASAHVATVAAFVTSLILIHQQLFYFIGYIPVALVVWSRLKLKRHTPLEVAVGGILGIILSIITYIIAKQIY